MQITSIINKNINDTIHITEELQQIVLEIFKLANKGITTNEMLAYYYMHINAKQVASSYAKVELASNINALKAARTALTYRGIIRQLPVKSFCNVTKRLVNLFIYVGSELSQQEQLLNEIARRELDIRRCELKIRELKARLVA